jgi:hypothetical protein
MPSRDERMNAPKVGIGDFVGQRSMLTPAIAGAITTLMTATLSTQFGLPANWTGLAISLGLAFTLLASQKISIGQRLGLGIINGLVIFSVALGANTAGVAAMRKGDRGSVQRTEEVHPAPPPAPPPPPEAGPHPSTRPPSVPVASRPIVPLQGTVQKQFFHHWLESR